MRSAIALMMLLGAPLVAQRHQIALTLGGLTPKDRLHGGTALQANYGLRLWQGQTVNLSLETHLLASPQRKVAFTDPNATSDVASLYVTPGLRFTFLPKSRLQPWAALGGGLAWYEHSELTQSGSSNAAPRNLYRGAFQFGGGVDYRLWKWLSVRAEVRDFLTGSPAYNIPGRGGSQHNLVAGGGLTLNFGE